MFIVLRLIKGVAKAAEREDRGYLITGRILLKKFKIYIVVRKSL